MTSTVLLDTNVFSAWLRPHSTLIPRYAKHVFGNRVAIAFQTVAEVRFGAITAGWGEKRIEAVERLIKRTVVRPPDDKTAWAAARLRAECRAGGHPLHQKAHAGDLWTAADRDPLAGPARRPRRGVPRLPRPRAAHRDRRLRGRSVSVAVSVRAVAGLLRRRPVRV